jgi:hypothetical protein
MDTKNVKPGDLIEWVYNYSNLLVYPGERLWSSVKKEWVPIGRELTHLCVSCDDKTITWLNEKGLFLARKDDMTPAPPFGGLELVVPRVRC